MAVNKKVFLTNSLFIYSGEIISKAVLFLFNALVARKLGAANYGIFTFGFSVCLLIVGFIDFGTNSLIFKKVSEDRQKNLDYIWKLVNIEVYLSVAATVLLLLFLAFISYDTPTKLVILILYFSFAFENITNVLRNALRGLELFKQDAFLNVLSSVSRLVLGLFFYFLVSNVYSLSAGVALSTLVVLIAGVMMVKTAIAALRTANTTGKGPGTLELIKECFIYAVPGILKGLYIRADSVMVKSFVSNLELGLYNSVTRLLYVQNLIPNAIIQVLFPTLNRLYHEKKLEEANNTILKVYILLFTSFNLIQSLQIIFSDTIINLVYGSSYQGAALIYRLMMLSFMFSASTILLNFIYIANDKVSLTNKYYMFGILLKVLLVFLLSRTLGVLGTTAAFLISEILQFAIFLLGSFLNNFKYKNIYVILPLGLVIVNAGLLYAAVPAFVKLAAVAAVTIAVPLAAGFRKSTWEKVIHG